MKNCTLKEALERCPNLVVGKADCMECKEAMCLLVHKHMCFGYCPAEAHTNLVEEIKKAYGHTTVPAVFIEGKFVGGHEKLKERLQ